MHFAVLITWFGICLSLSFVLGEQEMQDSFLGFRRTDEENNWTQEHHNLPDLLRGGAGEVLTASPSSISNGEDVTVSWSGITNPTSEDWIAIFCPGDAGSDENYLDRLNASGDDSGSVVFTNLINMRCEYGFRYYAGTQENGRYPLLAMSNQVTMKGGDNEVLQIHISLTSDPTEMQISWVTNSNAQDSVVMFGTSKTTLNQMSTSPALNSVTYQATDMCGSPANETSQQNFRNPGFIHTVTVSGLLPNSIYFYKCGNEQEGWSDVYWLRSSMSSNDFSDSDTAELSTKFVVYGDMGVSAPPAAVSTSTRVTNEVSSGSQFILHIGDISYARGFAYIWDQFFNLIESMASHVPYMINVGNHEYDHTTGGENDPSDAPGEGFHPTWGNYGNDSHGECSVPVYYRFHTPTNGHGLYWYSFDYGNVHVIMMSTEHNYTIGSNQYNWIENDLKHVNRERTPFIVLGGHRAMYESELFVQNWSVAFGMRQSFEDLLFNYKVDIAFWGHYHAYQRTCPVYQGKCNADGTTHIVVGTAGFSLDKGNLEIKTSWDEKFIIDWGYCVVTTNREELNVKFIRNENGSIGDEITLPAKF